MAIFAYFSIFPPKMRLRLTRNGQFHLIHNFSHLLPPKHLIFGEISKIFVSRGGYIGKFFEFSNFFKSFHTNAAENDPQLQIWPKKWLRLSQNGRFCIFFYLFPQNEAEIDSEWSISPDSQLFPSFATKASHFWRNLKNFHFWGGYIGKFFEFSNFFKSFHTNAAENDPQLQIWLKKWLRLGQNGHFCIFLNLSPQNEAEIDSEWSISPDSQLFPSFATKASHFWRNLKNFHFWGGYIGKFFEFSNFFKSFHTNAAENDPQLQIWLKKWLRLGQNGHFCIFLYLSPQNEAEIDSEWSISPDSQLFPSFATKASHFWRNLKNFHFGGGTLANFLSFPTFPNRLTPMGLKMTHNGKFGQKSGLD